MNKTLSIRIQNLTKRFGDYAALDNVSLDIRPGRLIALLGPSGSGKTTLLRIIAGLETADSGQVFFDGQDVSRLTPKEREVGLVFQHYALFRNMTVADNIAFGQTVKPAKLRPPKEEIRRRVDELLELVHLSGLQNRYPSQLSGGQKQRVALARTLAVEPRVLLLDEPFGALDAKVRKDLRRWLRQFHDRMKITTLFVTHDQEEALELADEVVVMNHARIEQIGTPQEVYDHPANRFVYEFIGSVNLFQGRINNGSLLIDGQQFRLSRADEVYTTDEGTAFVRPHDLHLHRIQPSGPHLKAIVETINFAGSNCRIHLKREDSGHLVEAEVSRREINDLQIKTGEMVYVTIHQVQAFRDDYSI